MTRRYSASLIGFCASSTISGMLVRPMLLWSRSSTTSNPAEVVTSNRTPSKTRSFFVTRWLIDGLQYSAWRRGVEMRGFLAKHLGVFDPDDIRILVGAFD